MAVQVLQGISHLVTVNVHHYDREWFESYDFDGCYFGVKFPMVHGLERYFQQLELMKKGYQISFSMSHLEILGKIKSGEIKVEKDVLKIVKRLAAEELHELNKKEFVEDILVPEWEALDWDIKYGEYNNSWTIFVNTQIKLWEEGDRE